MYTQAWPYACQMYPAKMSDEKGSSSQIVPLCCNTSDWWCKDMHVNWSGENIVHITFPYIACKNMWLGSVDTNVQTVTKYSAKCI